MALPILYLPYLLGVGLKYVILEREGPLRTTTHRAHNGPTFLSISMSSSGFVFLVVDCCGRIVGIVMRKL